MLNPLKVNKNTVFLPISGLFVLTYPTMIYNWNLSSVIGWHTTLGRDWTAFLWPIWFLLVYLSYQRLTAKNKPAKPTFFWTHVIVSTIPAFVLNYPFKIWILQSAIESEKILAIISIFNWATLLYLVIQVIFAILIFIKLVRL